MLWRKTWGRIPSFPERDETQKLIDKFGHDKTYEIMYEAQLLGFKKIRTLVNALDEKGNIKPKGGGTDSMTPAEWKVFIGRKELSTSERSQLFKDYEFKNNVWVKK